MARLSILSELGRAVAKRYGVRSVPTFLIFDSSGAMIARQVGFPDRDEIEALIAEA